MEQEIVKAKDPWYKRIPNKFAQKFSGSLFGEILGNATRHDESEDQPANIRDDDKIPWLITNQREMTMGEYKKKFKRTHIWFSYRFLKPMIWISKKMLGKYLVKEIANRPYNTNVLIFNEAFERSLQDWYWYYQRDETRPPEIEYGKYTDPKYGCHEMLRTIKRLLFTLIESDTAYKNFFDILAFNFTMGMNQNHDKEVHHLLYKGKQVNNILYYKVFGTVNKRYWVPFNGKWLLVDPQNTVVLDKLPDGDLKPETKEEEK